MISALCPELWKLQQSSTFNSINWKKTLLIQRDHVILKFFIFSSSSNCIWNKPTICLVNIVANNIYWSFRISNIEQCFLYLVIDLCHLQPNNALKIILYITWQYRSLRGVKFGIHFCKQKNRMWIHFFKNG